MNAPVLADLQAFVAFEACCLDEQRWAEWAALFAPDGWYWLPAATAHTDPLAQASHLYDDTQLREVKLRRLQSPQAHSQKPAGRCQLIERQIATGAAVGLSESTVRTQSVPDRLQCRAAGRGKVREHCRSRGH